MPDFPESKQARRYSGTHSFTAEHFQILSQGRETVFANDDLAAITLPSSLRIA